MSKRRSLTVHLDAATFASVEALARRHGIGSDAYVADAIRRIAETETAFWASVQRGIDDLDAGRSISHEKLLARMEEGRQCRDAAKLAGCDIASA